MTKGEMDRLCLEYAWCYDCPISLKTQHRMQALDEQVAKEGYKFVLINWSEYSMPDYLGLPKFVLKPAPELAHESEATHESEAQSEDGGSAK